MRKRNVILAAAFCAVGFTVGAAASGLVQKVESEIRPDFTIVIDGQERTFKNVDGETVYPMLYNGTTYLPVRAIGEIMGKTVYWYEDEKRIELKDSNSTVTDADVIVSGTSGGGGGSSIGTSGSIQTSAEDKITLEQAKKIAIEKAGLAADTQVTFTGIELDNEKDRRKYEIEFYYDGTKYSADISTADGSVLSWDVEKKTNNGNGNGNNGNNSTSQQSGEIDVESAKQIALDKSGLSAADVTFRKAQREFDDGVWIYDIEFYQGRTEYSAEILASDGSIITWEVDND
jgi:uncharacterized membrane protein YkoI